MNEKIANRKFFKINFINILVTYIRLFYCFSPVNDNRASLLRSSTTIKKPANERDVYIHVWKNYITFAFRVVPPVPSPIVRCASPDLSLRYVTPHHFCVMLYTLSVFTSRFL